LAKHSHPLAGKIVVLTRAPEQSQELADALEALGAGVRVLPMIALVAPERSGDLDSALSRLAEFDWILFTSQNAVRFLFRRGCELKNRRVVQPARPLIAAIGTATAQAARNLDIRVDFVATSQTGESLARELRGQMSGASVLLPRSDRADDRLPAILREFGAKVTEVVAYRTAIPESFDSAVLDAVKQTQVDVIVFASPSAFDNFCTAIAPLDRKELSNRVHFAAIGPTTAATIREAGARVAMESSEPTPAALAAAIAEHYVHSPCASRPA
jgi:uroporphyrinogen III methyltransferase/synthase